MFLAHLIFIQHNTRISFSGQKRCVLEPDSLSLSLLRRRFPVFSTPPFVCVRYPFLFSSRCSFLCLCRLPPIPCRFQVFYDIQLGFSDIFFRLVVFYFQMLMTIRFFVLRYNLCLLDLVQCAVIWSEQGSMVFCKFLPYLVLLSIFGYCTLWLRWPDPREASPTSGL